MLYFLIFSTIPASAAVLEGKSVVSSETFTCLYGWPRDYIREQKRRWLRTDHPIIRRPGCFIEQNNILSVNIQN